MEHILAVAVVLVNTALAVAEVIAYRRLSRRIDAISRPAKPVSDRYCAPPDILDPSPPDGVVDTAGAWALERESLGIRVSDEEITEVRRRWAEFAAA